MLLRNFPCLPRSRLRFLSRCKFSAFTSTSLYSSRLYETLELVGQRSRVHVVGRRERLNRFFVALAAIARLLSFSHGRSLSGCLGGKPPFSAELATPRSQPLKLVSEALLHVPLNPRLQTQRSGQIEGAQIAVFIPRIFLCCELSCSPSALAVCCEAWYIRTAG